ncbi:MAG: chemotaxis protein CheW [Dehalococcoidia bacterium]|nr:chemotaxis protein CheW [Dehalococcoidia bacterium]
MNTHNSNERQLVVFDLAGESFGVDINTVRAIIRMQHVTRVPDAPAYVEGVMNLRGTVIPVVDLRLRFGLEVTETTVASRVVVVDIGGAGIVVIVDGVRAVLRIPASSVEAPSTVITTMDSYYLDGIANLDGRLLILLDIERALAECAQVALLLASREQTAIAA